mmetsp:Transcript_796/g.1759  ORF Transcript_796/g.1759 Transcript_796/m.1759 type:complete len:273 (-) Transcript_796:241-1059(-)|eukprot:CAMPEP_0119191074 /NCGR_PEP_ID=MMETSP1316-20130426/1978_1 /TAXON_ID=41880 /ORGANISM="Pycnococcus provasolii, Strain RCC2336" /LENGTH=272 /DNA_ID=CAMNT_0007186051 /DNA_START=107 /DNA_END=925 /DNA_ORIENTATION=-
MNNPSSVVSADHTSGNNQSTSRSSPALHRPLQLASLLSPRSISSAAATFPTSSSSNMSAILETHGASIFHLLCIGTSLAVAFSVLDGSRFGYHPSCMALAYLLFMAEGALTAIKFRSLEGPERTTAIWKHASLQSLGVLFAIIGFYAIYTNKSIHGKPHFTSYHSYAGLLAFVLAIVAPLGGAVSFKRLGLLTRLPQQHWAPIKYVHRKVGQVTVFVGLLAIVLALTHKAVYLGIVSYLLQLCVLAVAAYLAHTLVHFSSASMLPMSSQKPN